MTLIVLAAFPRLLIGLWLATVAGRGAVDLSDYQIRVWTTEHGLPQSAILALCQTRDGYLWVGNPTGLARFDGVRFTVFDVLKNPEMGNDTCRSLAEDTDGNLWIATNDGLLQWADYRFRRFTTVDGLPHNETRTVWPSRSGGVWVGLTEGYARYHNGSFTNYSHHHGPIGGRSAVYEDTSGVVWLSGSHSLWRSDSPAQHWEPVADYGEPASRRVQCFHPGRDGRVWFGSSAGLNCWDKGAFVRFNPAASVEDIYPEPELVDCILELSDGRIWAAVTGNHILHQLENGRFTPLLDHDGKPIEQVTALLEDREGNIWIGTRFRGLIKLHKRHVHVYSAKEGLANDAINTVCQTADGTIWVGASRGYFSTVRGGQVDSYRVAGEQFKRSEVAIYPDCDGQLWFGVRGENDEETILWQWQNAQLTPTSIAVDSKYIWALYDDRQGSLWIGTERGARRLRFDNQTLSDVAGLPPEKVSAFLRDTSGRLWIATDAGLGCLQDEKLALFSVRNGLSHDFICCVYEDRQKGIWIGTRHGLALYNEGNFSVLTREHGLPDDTICNILEDNDGRIWMSSNRGIHRVTLPELYDAVRGKAQIHAVSFGQADGMISSETRSKAYPSAWKANDGRLWFTTTKGVAVINPATATENTNLPSVVIEQVLAQNEVVFGLGAPRHGGAARAAGGGSTARAAGGGSTARAAGGGSTARAASSGAPNDFRLGAGRGRVVEFRYTAMSFVAPEKVQFKYQLEGHDREWVDGGSRRAAYYTNLRPGHYQFLVKACNNAGKWNESPVALSFYVAPHFYQTIPFRVGSAGAALLVGVLFHRRRMNVQTRIQRLEHTNQLEKERARIAQDMHDDLGANLTQVAILSEVVKQGLQPEKAAEHVDRISAAARSMIDNIAEIIWAIAPRNDQLDSLCAFLREQAAQRCEEGGIECQLSFPAEAGAVAVTAEFRRNLLLVLKESLNNLLKHSGATRATIVLRTFRDGDRDWVEFLVSDNGRGFDPANVPRFRNGLGNMHERMQSLGGTFSVTSAPGNGTEIRAKAPLGAHPSAPVG